MRALMGVRMVTYYLIVPPNFMMILLTMNVRCFQNKPITCSTQLMCRFEWINWGIVMKRMHFCHSYFSFRCSLALFHVTCWPPIHRKHPCIICLFISSLCLTECLFCAFLFRRMGACVPNGGSRGLGPRNRRARPLDFDRLCLFVFCKSRFVSECFKIRLR